MADVKSCEACGALFERGKRSFEAWGKRRFCSLKCFGVNLRTDPIDRFPSYVAIDPDTNCWNWKGHVHRRTGYGVYRSDGAHRFSYQTYVGPISDGLFVLHKCDNRKCVNPEHLFLGTNQDNMDDMIAKGRASKASGESVASAKLTASKVIAIRADQRPALDIARDYGVTRGNIYSIKKRKSWSHV